MNIKEEYIWVGLSHNETPSGVIQIKASGNREEDDKKIASLTPEGHTIGGTYYLEEEEDIPLDKFVNGEELRKLGFKTTKELG